MSKHQSVNYCTQNGHGSNFFLIPNFLNQFKFDISLFQIMRMNVRQRKIKIELVSHNMGIKLFSYADINLLFLCDKILKYPIFILNGVLHHITQFPT